MARDGAGDDLIALGGSTAELSSLPQLSPRQTHHRPLYDCHVSRDLLCKRFGKRKGGGLTLEFLLNLEDISKSFFGIHVLKNVHFDLCKGEIHALLGENGAGKSTLIKIISGAYKADTGTILFDGKRVHPHYGPKAAEDLGIVTIYQNFHLIPHLSVAENVALRTFTSKREIFINWRAVNREARATLESIDFHIDPKYRVKDLSVAKKQMLEIAIALSKEARIIIMDEPTAALSKNEAEVLFGMMLRLKAKGLGIIYVSHKLEEIKALGDRVTILRDGKNVATVKVREVQLKEIVGYMIGRELAGEPKRAGSKKGKSMLSVKNVTTKHFSRPLNLSLRENEILGITGLVGSGKTELARAIFGADQRKEGQIYLDGRALPIKSPRDAVKLGIGYLPEDRDREGLCLNMGIKENITLALFAKLKALFFDAASEKRIVSELVKSIRIRAASVWVQVKYLSGGNKQKVVFGKWLEAECRILILDEPTIGIDIGARREIYELVERFARKPERAIIIISSDVNEILEVADRILVMENYHIVAELNTEETNKQEIMEYSMGLISQTSKSGRKS
jgi:ribose transport system ATP-binding protein